MTPNQRPPDRPRLHPSRGPAAPVAVRLKMPDRERLCHAADARGLTLSNLVRGLILDALDADAPAPV